jgi:hypothetical protein
MSKPEVDTKDPQSVRKYAGWLQSQGNEAEAMRYLQLADKLDAENRTMVAMSSAADINEKAAIGAQQGDVRYVQEQIKQARQGLRQAAEAKDADGMKVYQGQLAELNKMLPGARDTAATKKVSGAIAFEKMLADGTRIDPETGKPVPLTEEQKNGISNSLENLLEDPDTRKGYVDAKVREDQARRLEQDQADEQVIAAGSQAIFGAASPEEAEEALQKALESPDVSPRARQSLVQMSNTKVAALDKAQARKERVTELNTPVITKEDRESFKQTLSSLPKDSPVTKQLAEAFKGIEEAQDKITSGGQGFATKSAREALAKRYNGLQNQAMNLAFAEDSARRQTEAAEDRKNAGIYLEAKANAALGPSRTDVTQLMKASEDSGENYTYEEAKAKLQADLNSKVERIRPLVAPEDQARVDADREEAEKEAKKKPMPAGLSAAQEQILIVLRTNNPTPKGTEQAAHDAMLIAAAGEKWKQAGGKKSSGPAPFGALSEERNTGRLGSFLGDMISNIGTVRTAPTPAEAAEQERFRNR